MKALREVFFHPTPELFCATWNAEKVRRDFPILSQKVNKKPLIYLDNAATSQKPQIVIDTLKQYYEKDNANIHRGVHFLSEHATDQYEKAREKIARFLNAKDHREIIFARGTTEAINLVAQTYGRKNIKAGDEILISMMEHHSNIVPWQMLCEQTGAVLKIIPINLAGEIVFEEYTKLLSDRTKLVAISHISNALGTINPIKKIIDLAHQYNARVLIDGAQAAPHVKVDVQALDCDFYAFSGHKCFGPTGIGVLYGKAKILEDMPPYQGGGDMISQVSFEKTTYNHIPYKFEAGTPAIAEVIGLGAAIDYLNEIGFEKLAHYEHELLQYATEALSRISGLRIIGTAKEKASVISFVLEDIHPHDIGTVLDLEGIAIRTGHHCAMPLMQWYQVPATARASFSFYNTQEEIDALVKGIIKVKEVFK